MRILAGCHTHALSRARIGRGRRPVHFVDAGSYDAWYASPMPTIVDLFPDASAPAYRLLESADTPSFLALRRFEVRLGDEHGAYDLVTRAAQDAAVIAPFFDLEGVRHVVLRFQGRIPLVVQGHTGGLWELPAGLIEPGESPEHAAQRELLEELGARAVRLGGLGPPTYPLPAVICERQFFFWAEVPPPPWPEPAGDGTVFERGVRFHSLTLSAALDACRSGLVQDAKTELALRRLAEML
jgi:ADP-ribose pyrophosphatase